MAGSDTEADFTKSCVCQLYGEESTLDEERLGGDYFFFFSGRGTVCLFVRCGRVFVLVECGTVYVQCWYRERYF